jgi:hypothetical protein
MAQYKTIALELLQQQPELYEQLRQSRTLLATLDDYAATLRAAHLAWTEELRLANSGSDPVMLSSEALEMAIEDLRERLPSAWAASEEGEGLSLDDAMSYLRRHTPPA